VIAGCLFDVRSFVRALEMESCSMGTNNDPRVTNEGSKPDLDELTRKAQKEQDEKLRKGGTDEIKIKQDGGNILDGVVFP
jgi:hypothetical protein